MIEKNYELRIMNYELRENYGWGSMKVLMPVYFAVVEKVEAVL